MRFRDFLILGVFWGVVTGFVEFAKFKFSDSLTLCPLIVVNEHSLWMAPVGNALVFALFGVILYPMHRLFPRLVTPHRCVAAFIFLACFDLLTLVKSLHIIAVLVLSLGLAKLSADIIFAKSKTRVARVFRWAHWFAGMRKTKENSKSPGTAGPSELEVDRRRVLVTVALAVGAPAIGVSAWMRYQERQRLTRLPASDSSRPSVLLLVLDTVRARNLSLYGYERKTMPNLERFAAGGACFEWAIAAAPWTLPSHASMFTGQHTHKLNCAYDRPLNKKYVTLAEVLAARGYATSGFVANTQYCASKWGVGRGFIHYEDMYFNLERFVMSSNVSRTVLTDNTFRRITASHDQYARPYAPAINQRLLRWLDGNQHRPFFAFVNYFEAHAPYCPPSPFDSKFGPKRPPSKPPFVFRAEFKSPYIKPGWLSDGEIRIEQDAYDGCLACLDQELGHLFGELSRRGILENTLVIVVGDHGEEFAEHGIMAHAGSLYMPSLHVPLIMSMPGRIPVNTRIPAPVSLRDLPHTIMTMVDRKGNNVFPGSSWLSHLSRNSNDPSPTVPLISSTQQLIRKASFYPASRGNMKSVCIGSHHCIFNGDDKVELYDFMADPLETKDIADSPEGREITADCRKLIDAS